MPLNLTTTKKAQALAGDLASDLALRFGTSLAVTQLNDTDGNPLVRVGSGTAGQPGALIKVMPVSWPLATDVLGLPQQVYTPHVIIVSWEAPTAQAGADADPNSLQTKLTLLGDCALKGTRLELWTTAAGTAPAPGALGTLQASFEPSVQYPMISNQ
jgi:hypothetical protein